MENAERIDIMRTARPGSIVIVPTYTHPDRSCWLFGDDLSHFPWFRECVAGELFGLARVDLDRLEPQPAVELAATYDPPSVAKPASQIPTYRELLDATQPWPLASAGAVRVTIEAHGMFTDSQRRPVIVFEEKAPTCCLPSTRACAAVPSPRSPATPIDAGSLVGIEARRLPPRAISRRWTSPRSSTKPTRK